MLKAGGFSIGVICPAPSITTNFEFEILFAIAFITSGGESLSSLPQITNVGRVIFERLSVVPNSHDVTIDNAAGASAVNIQDGGNSITIDATSLPLPTGAATAANQLPNSHDVTIDNLGGASAVNIQDGGNSITVDGAVSVTGASGADEDLLAFFPTQLGATTTGTWSLYFDGSDVGLSSTSNEDVNGVWVDAAGQIYLTTLGNFSVTGVSGDGSDIFICTPGLLGRTTTCTWSMYWDGSVIGFSGEDTDLLSILP